MKRIGNLYDEIASPDNVRAAILKASRGKRDRPQVRAVLDDLENKVLELSHALRTETVELHQYTADQRVEGSRNKKRVIHKPRFWPDQCVHWAIYNVMGAHLYRGFTPSPAAAFQAGASITVNVSSKSGSEQTGKTPGII